MPAVMAIIAGCCLNRLPFFCLLKPAESNKPHTAKRAKCTSLSKWGMLNSPVLGILLGGRLMASRIISAHPRAGNRYFKAMVWWLWKSRLKKLFADQFLVLRYGEQFLGLLGLADLDLDDPAFPVRVLVYFIGVGFQGLVKLKDLA